MLFGSKPIVGGITNFFDRFGILKTQAGLRHGIGFSELIEPINLEQSCCWSGQMEVDTTWSSLLTASNIAN